MNSKKVLIVSRSLKLGGVQKSLINLLNSLEDSSNIDLYLFFDGGEFKEDLSNINIVRSSKFINAIGMSMKQAINSRKFFVIMFRLFAISWSKLFNNYIPISIALKSEKIVKEYDVAISFIHDSSKNSLYSGCNRFVLERVNAKQKIAWIHGDYEKAGLNNKETNKIYRKFDKLVAVSYGCKEIIDRCSPQLGKKCSVVSNCYEIERIRKDSMEKIEDFNREEGCINFTTVARFGREKGFLRAIEVMNILKKEKFNFRWHIVGDGSEKKIIEEKIYEYNLQNHIILHGYRKNPYPYIKSADFYLMASFHEAAPMTVGEAKILGIPIVACNYASANEQIIDHYDGIICENSADSLYHTLKKLIKEPILIENFRDHLRCQEITNEQSINQFINVVYEDK